MKRTLLALASVAALAMVGTASATVKPMTHGSTQFVIRHAHFGCHTWERAGMVAGTARTITIHVGHPLTIVNRDGADHTLVQTSGPTTMAPTLLPHVGAPATPISFFTPGTYTFTTKETAHQPSMRDGIGDPKDVPDNTLTLKVIVTSEYE